MQSDRTKFKNEFKSRLFIFVKELIIFLDRLPYSSSSKILINQLIRSSTSVLANYIEAQAASSKKDFINFFNHALKSANESKVWLALLKDTQNINPQKLDNFLNEIQEISKILASSILTLKGKR